MKKCMLGFTEDEVLYTVYTGFFSFHFNHRAVLNPPPLEGFIEGDEKVERKKINCQQTSQR
jgi:hypothetical protein